MRRSFVVVALLAGLAAGVYPQLALGAFPGTNGKIAFSSTRGDGNARLYTMDPDGSDVSQLGDATFAIDPSWSADGENIAFVGRGSDPFSTRIWTMKSDGSNEVRLTDGPPVAFDNAPSWSPDGTKIAFQSDRDRPLFGECPEDPSGGCPYETNVYVLDLATGTTTRLTFDTYASESVPVWSPDGQKIAFTRQQMYFADELWLPMTSMIYTMSPNGSGPAPLGSGAEPDWSPDGSRIVFSSEFFGPDIGVMNADGSGRHLIRSGTVDGTHEFYEPVWSPDGAKIAFRTTYIPGDPERDIYTMNADGSGAVNLTSSATVDFEPDWQPLPPNREPDCSMVTASPAQLSPADRRLVLVELGGATDPDGDQVALRVSGVTQDEPLTGSGDDTSPDAFSKQLTHEPTVAATLDNDPNEVYLRAERRNSGDGRVYRVSFTGDDGRGGTCSGSVKVSVPRKAGSPARDSAPPSYDSFGS